MKADKKILVSYLEKQTLLRNEEEYRAAVSKFSVLWNTSTATEQEEQEMSRLAALIEAYESLRQ